MCHVSREDFKNSVVVMFIRPRLGKILPRISLHICLLFPKVFKSFVLQKQARIEVIDDKFVHEFLALFLHVLLPMHKAYDTARFLRAVLYRSSVSPRFAEHTKNVQPYNNGLWELILANCVCRLFLVNPNRTEF